MTKSRTRDPKATRRKLLDAAAEICAEGANSVSLEAVAARAGVSKGGLLYHFPSKNALLRAMVADHVAAIRAQVESRAPGAFATDQGAPGLPGARAYLQILQAELLSPKPTSQGFLAAMLEDPEFMAPVLDFRRDLRGLFARCPDPASAGIVYLACEGLVHEMLTDPHHHLAPKEPTIFVDLEAMLGSPA